MRLVELGGLVTPMRVASAPPGKPALTVAVAAATQSGESRPRDRRC